MITELYCWVDRKAIISPLPSTRAVTASSSLLLRLRRRMELFLQPDLLLHLPDLSYNSSRGGMKRSIISSVRMRLPSGSWCMVKSKFWTRSRSAAGNCLEATRGGIPKGSYFLMIRVLEVKAGFFFA